MVLRLRRPAGVLELVDGLGPAHPDSGVMLVCIPFGVVELAAVPLPASAWLLIAGAPAGTGRLGGVAFVLFGS